MTAVRGNQVAMVTPMTPDFEVDYAGAARLAEYLIAHGADGLLVAGVTGESFSLSEMERRVLADRVLAQAAGRIPVGVNVSHPVTREAVRLAKHAEASGASYVLLAPPAPFATGQATIEQTVVVAESLTVPVMLYDGADGISIPLAAYDAILERAPAVRFSKVNVPEPEKIKVLHDRYGDRLGCFAGRDDHCLLALAYGAQGFVCATSNLLPAVVSSVFREYVGGAEEAARRSFYTLVAPVLVPIFAARHLFIQSIKATLCWLGVIGSPAARPCLVAPGDGHLRELRRALSVAGLLAEPAGRTP